MDPSGAQLVPILGPAWIWDLGCMPIISRKGIAARVPNRAPRALIKYVFLFSLTKNWTREGCPIIQKASWFIGTELQLKITVFDPF